VFDLHNFDLCNVFQECNPGIKLDLPVLSLKCHWCHYKVPYNTFTATQNNKHREVHINN
jgi:hypothetical protein